MSFYSEDCFTPEISIGYLIRRAHLLGAAALDPIFNSEGLTATQWQALVAIWFGRGNTAAELARDLGHDKGAMTRLIDALEARGWITRERTVEDRRCVNLSLTHEGEAVAIRCKKRVVACWNAWLADWSDDEARTLIRLLQKVHTTIAGAAPCA